MVEEELVVLARPIVATVARHLAVVEVVLKVSYEMAFLSLVVEEASCRLEVVACAWMLMS